VKPTGEASLAVLSADRSADSLVYDALLFVSFGGPEGPDEVMPFLRRVTRGRGVPEERLLEVAKHYETLGGRSPINEQNRAFIEALDKELRRRGRNLPIRFGNRNWHPLLETTLAELKAEGARRVLAFVSSAFSSYSGCRQYQEDIAEALAAAGEGGPEVDKVRVFFNHPGFIEAVADRLRSALANFPPELRDEVAIVFTAHSIPRAMADRCSYVEQLREAASLALESLGRRGGWELAFQSRSGPPSVPWLEPDILEVVRRLAAEGKPGLLVMPLGFLSDHVEVIYDLDHEARDLAAELGLRFERAPTVGSHPAFVGAVADLIEEHLDPSRDRLALGRFGPREDHCPLDCCSPPRRQA